MLDAEPVIELESLGVPLGAKSFPGKRSVALTLLEGSAPGSHPGNRIFDRGVIRAAGGQQRVGNRLPGGVSNNNRFALELGQTLNALTLPEREIENVVRAHLEHGDDRHVSFE